MVSPWKRIGLLVGVVAVAASAPARAEDDPQPKPKPRTVTITECVEQKYQVKREGYRIECREKVVEGFRYETACVPREQVCTVVRRVPEVHQEIRRVCCNTWCWEDRVVMKPCWETRQVTKCVQKCVSKGHWECQEVCARPSCLDRLRHHNDCCNPCNNCCCTTTKKVWVHCPQYVSCPVTCCEKVCVQKPVCCKVKVCKTEVREVQVQVCHYRCVEEKVVQKYTEQVCQKVACKVTCCERVCVPCETTVVCTRLVPRQREVEVAECTPCCTPCCNPCCDPCCNHGRHGLHFRNHSCCH